MSNSIDLNSVRSAGYAKLDVSEHEHFRRAISALFGKAGQLVSLPDLDMDTVASVAGTLINENTYINRHTFVEQYAKVVKAITGKFPDDTYAARITQVTTEELLWLFATEKSATLKKVGQSLGRFYVDDYLEGTHSTFLHGTHTYTVDSLLKACETMPVRVLPPSVLKQYIYTDSPRDIDWERVRAADLTFPVILLNDDKRALGRAIPLDGFHRVMKAIDENKDLRIVLVNEQLLESILPLRKRACGNPKCKH